MSWSDLDCYPANSLPENLRQAIEAVRQETMAPYGLVASSALGVVSLLCQDHVDVKLPYGGIAPVSLFFLTVAESGERKTSVDRFFMSMIDKFEKKVSEMRIDLDAEHAAAEDRWNLILAKIKKELSRTKSGTENELAHQVEEHIRTRPKKAKLPSLIVRDTTPEALVYRLYSKWKSAGLMSSEAGSILNGRATSQLAMLNLLWDGDSCTVDRKSSESFTLTDARLSASLMIQPDSFLEFLNKHGRHARDNGFLARCLFSKPTSTQGVRVQYDLKKTKSNDLRKFEQRADELLQLLLMSGGNPERRVLEFSVEASQRWLSFQNEVESSIGPQGDNFHIRDVASKAGQQVARLAALLHFFENEVGEIQARTVESAICICGWHGYQFSKAFTPAPAIPEVYAFAQSLDQWLRNNFFKNGTYIFRKNMIRQFGPSLIRSSERLHQALSILESQNITRRFKPQGQNVWHVEFNTRSLPLTLGVINC